MTQRESLKKVVDWNKVDQPLSGLATNIPHEIQVRREAVPVIFVPGIMGSRLRLSGTDGTGSTNGLKNLRWDPSPGYLYSNYGGASPAHRKAMLISPDSCDPDYLEVDNDPVFGNGYRGLHADYRKFLEVLRKRNWGEVGKLFIFPIYGFGYNWTSSNRLSGQKLAVRIQAVIDECKKVAGKCEKVILVTHSMGGLVARAACKMSGIESKVLGVIHGVQPAFGAPAAYWRMKAGFESNSIADWIASSFLGSSGREVTAVLANTMGGLQLLPNKQFMTGAGARRWLSVPNLAGTAHALPRHGDPFRDIYRVPAVVNPAAGTGETENAYWGLVDPALLTPEVVHASNDNPLDDAADSIKSDDVAWNYYLDNLLEAENFGDEFSGYRHPKTWYFNGAGRPTAENIAYLIESKTPSDNYPKRGFFGAFRGERGVPQQATLQPASGDGDGTVPASSATFNGSTIQPPGPPAHHSFKGLKHQPAYGDKDAQGWAISAITSLAWERFKEVHG